MADHEGGNLVAETTREEHQHNLRAKRVVLLDASGNQITSFPVTATDLDIRNLVFATDKVDASGTVLGTGTNNIGDVDVLSSALPSGASTSANQSTIITNLQTINSLVPSTYDYISLAYTGANLTSVVFKTGGSGGTTVSTLTLAYTGSSLTSVTKT